MKAIVCIVLGLSMSTALLHAQKNSVFLMGENEKNYEKLKETSAIGRIF
jgi:hypothetical protein